MRFFPPEPVGGGKGDAHPKSKRIRLGTSPFSGGTPPCTGVRPSGERWNRGILAGASVNPLILQWNGEIAALEISEFQGN